MPSFNQITQILAVYGAILSTLLALMQIIKDMRRIKVVVDFSITVDSRDGENSTISIRAVNVGHRPVEITRAGFIYQDGGESFQLKSSIEPNPLPYRIGDGESVVVPYNLIDFEGIRFGEEFKELHLRRAFVKDAEGHRYSVRLTKDENMLLDQATRKFLEKERNRLGL